MKSILAFLSLLYINIVNAQRGAGECAMLCNDLRFEVLTLEICREARRTLPRPKVGDFCGTAMEQGFSDACVSLCQGQNPVARVAQACRAAAIEMPRPTVRRWCEHGYNTGFQKTLNDLYNHFNIPDSVDTSTQDNIDTQDSQSGSPSNPQPDHKVADHYPSQDKEDVREVIARIPVTMSDGRTLTLALHQGQQAEDAVVAFCGKEVGADHPDEVAPCIRHLLEVVMDKLQELNLNA